MSGATSTPRSSRSASTARSESESSHDFTVPFASARSKGKKDEKPPTKGKKDEKPPTKGKQDEKPKTQDTPRTKSQDKKARDTPRSASTDRSTATTATTASVDTEPTESSAGTLAQELKELHMNGAVILTHKRARPKMTYTAEDIAAMKEEEEQSSYELSDSDYSSDDE